MTFRPAIDEITLALGGNTVRLRPSLRAATRLERLHDGFAGLLRNVSEFHFGTVCAVILTAATDRQEATALLAQINSTPLRDAADAITAPILALCAAFIPASDEDAKPQSSAKPMPWPDFYRELYRTATGWLHWTPEAAWNATPTEINEAFAGHIAMLRAIHGNPDDADSKPDAYSAEQLQQIDDQGFDPAFDRAGLSALKAKIQRAA